MSEKTEFRVLFTELERLKREEKCAEVRVSEKEIKEMDEVRELREIVEEISTCPLVTYTTS